MKLINQSFVQYIRKITYRKGMEIHMELLIKGLYGIGEGFAILAMSACSKIYHGDNN